MNFTYNTLSFIYDIAPPFESTKIANETWNHKQLEYFSFDNVMAFPQILVLVHICKQSISLS